MVGPMDSKYDPLEVGGVKTISMCTQQIGWNISRVIEATWSVRANSLSMCQRSQVR
jgi:hypothetical protein